MPETVIETESENPPKISLTQRLVQVAKQLWMIVVLVGLALFVSNNFDNIVEQLQEVSLLQLGLSLLMIVVGRILMMILAHDALLSLKASISRQSVLTIVAISDPAKYLPGGIWHFVGRAGYYQAEGATLKTATQALLRENLWLVVSALFSGAIFLIIAYANPQLWFLCIVIVLCWIGVLKLWTRHFSWIRLLIQMTMQCVMWLLLAYSFMIIFPAIPGTIEMQSLVFAAFTLSWLIGFLSLFAPGGLGIRETILVVLLIPILSAGDSSVLAITHRLLWIGVEVLFALVAWIFLNKNVG